MRTALLTLVATALVAAAPQASHAAAPTAADSPCALTTITLPDGSKLASIHGGPVAQTGLLTCTVQTGPNYTDPDVDSRSAPGVATTVLPPTTVTVPAVAQLYVCSTFTDTLATAYHFDNRTGSWTTSTSAKCVPYVNVDTTPLRDVEDFTPGFPPAGFAVTSVGWVMTPGSTAPAFSPPLPRASHPADWTCGVSYNPTTKIGHAECTPVPGQEDPGFTGWTCYDPYVAATIANTPGNTGDEIRGVSSCGNSVAECRAMTSARQPSASCTNYRLLQRPVPLVCDADFSGASTDRTATVRCSTIDP